MPEVQEYDVTTKISNEPFEGPVQQKPIVRKRDQAESNKSLKNQMQKILMQKIPQAKQITCKIYRLQNIQITKKTDTKIHDGRN